MIARFRVATRQSGIRRQVWVHVYDDREELARAHNAAMGQPYDPSEDIAGGVVHRSAGGGFRWPAPDPGPVIVMRLWTEQLTTSTIAHEATHAACCIYFMDVLPGWDSRARVMLMGDHEPLAYLVGDIARDVVAGLDRRNLIPR